MSIRSNPVELTLRRPFHNRTVLVPELFRKHLLQHREFRNCSGIDRASHHPTRGDARLAGPDRSGPWFR